jgi:hypothetical protein
VKVSRLDDQLFDLGEHPSIGEGTHVFIVPTSLMCTHAQAPMGVTFHINLFDLQERIWFWIRNSS